MIPKHPVHGRFGVNAARKGPWLLTAAFGVWTLGSPGGLAEDQDHDRLSGNREENAGARSTSASLGRYIPNVRFGGSTQRIAPQIRGFGTPADIQEPRSFEGAVALLIDGVPYSRSQYFQTALFDLDRVEALRGPQGTLFGKNASVGALNLSTKDPTDEFTGHVDLQFGELDRRRFEGAIGGPVLPGFLNFHVAGLSDQQDGFIENTTAAVDPSARRRNGARDHAAARLKLDFPDLFGASLRLSYERFDAQFAGRNIEFRRVPENLRPYLLQFDPNTDFEPDNFVGSIDTETPVSNVTDTFVANATYDLLGWNLEVVAGGTLLDSFTTGDSFDTPAPETVSSFIEGTPQLTFEGLVPRIVDGI